MIKYNLIHGDCLEEMKKLPDKAVDVIRKSFTDTTVISTAFINCRAADM